MWHRYSSTDRLPSTRSEVSRSPYAKNYRTNLTHDQREQLSHRQNISRLPRGELEDRYIALVDEHFALKKENAANNEKVRKMATKLLRLSAEGKSRGTPFPMQLSPNENLEIQIIRLEAYNSLLKDRLHAIIKKYSHCIQSTATSSIRRPASCSNLSIKRKIILSQDDLNLLEIPEPPTMMSKIDNRSSCGSGSGLASSGRKPNSSKINYDVIQLQHQHKQPVYQQCQSSVVIEHENTSNLQECGQSSLGEGTSQKIENERIEMRTGSNKHLNVVLEEKMADEMLTRHSESAQLAEMRRTMADCEAELHELRQQYIILKTKAECELDEGHRKIDELTRIVQKEMEKNTQLSTELHAIQNAAEVIESIQNIERENVQPTNVKLEEKQSNSSKMPQRNDDLPELLNEAKSTIIQLQEDVTHLKSHIELLRGENEKYTKEIVELKGKQKHVSTNSEQVVRKGDNEASSPIPPPIPLEPIVIVNGANDFKNSPNSRLIQNENPPNTFHEVIPDSASSSKNEHSFLDEPSFSSDDTFVVPKGNHGDDIPFPTTPTRFKHFSNRDTDSELSTFDSDENYRAFKLRNKELETTLLLHQSPRTIPMSFTQRLSLLERTAYYQPLTNIVTQQKTPKNDDDHYLACNCAGFECDQQTEHFYEAIRKSVKNAKSILLKEIQENLNSSSSCNGDTNPTVINKHSNESSECREFLRVQYNLNNLYKQELEMVCKTCKKQTQQFLNEIEMLKLKLQTCEEQLKLAQSADNGQPIEGHSTRMVHIGYNEGSFELHVIAFRPTKEGRTFLSCRHGELTSLFVSWNFFNIDSESKTSTRPPPNYIYRSSYIYVVPMKKAFLDQLQEQKLSIKLFAIAGSNELLMGTADINFGEVLVFPQNKIQLTTKIMSTVSSAGTCDHDAFEKYCACTESARKSKHLGNLTIWFRLTCELDVLKSFANKHWIGTKAVDNFDGHRMSKQQKQSLMNEEKTTKSYRNETEKNLKSLTAITINRLKLNNSEQLRNDNVQSISIDYSFLGNHHLKSESKMLDGDEVFFNFCQKFANDERNCKKLKEILKTKRSVKIIVNNSTSNVVNGMASDAASNLDGNKVVGFGLLHLEEVIRSWNGNDGGIMDDNCAKHSFEIPILMKRPPYQHIGCLAIAIENMISLKRIQQQINNLE